MLALLLAAALAAPMDLASGADLTAIRAIETASLADDEAIDAWRSFLLAFPDSPLATTAWRELAALGGTEGDWIPADRQLAMTRIAREVREEDEETARRWVSASVAPLHADGTPVVADRPPWTSRLEANVGWDGLGYAAFGAGLGHGPVLGLLRIGRQRAWYAELAGRVKGPLSFGPWLEVHVDSLLRPGLSGGGEIALWEGLGLEARAGVLVDNNEVLPRIGASLVYRLPAPRMLTRESGT